MPSLSPSSAAALLALAACCPFSAAFAQGSLTPPGAPAPSMKSMADLEPRIPIQSLTGDATSQYLITQPGNYYLTGNLVGVASKSVIAIDADGVTIDLGGHALIGLPTSFSGVELRNNHSQITVENGSIRGFTGGAGGVYVISNVSNSRFSRLNVTGCSSGLNLLGSGSGNDGVVVRECQVSGANCASGIMLATTRGAVERCTVSGLSSASVVGINARMVVGCDVTGLTATSGSATGISAAGPVSQCSVGPVGAAAGANATGISCYSATNCDVADIIAGTGGALGISANGAVHACNVSNVAGNSSGNTCTGISAGTVTASRAQSIAPNGRGLPIGINAASVSASSVSSVGGSQGTFAPVGIFGGTVHHCAVQSVGNGAAAAGAVGISATNVSDSTASSIVGGTTGNTTGISGTNVQRCVVSSVSLAGGSGTANGISGEEIVGCRVTNVTSGATSTAAGLTGYRLCRDSSVATVTCTNGVAWGAQSGNSGRTECVTVLSVTNAGIAVTSNHVVSGCVLSGCTTGIQATGVRNVIDGNNITGTSTTGISAVSGTNLANSLIIRNQIRNCTTNIAADAPCQVGPVVLATGTISGTNPWSNFTD